MKHELCKLADIPVTGTRVVPFFKREVHIHRTAEGVRAFANVCLHLGGPLECKDGKMVCPWHQASYDLESGERIDGPAPPGSRLMVLPTRVERDRLFYVWGE